MTLSLSAAAYLTSANEKILRSRSAAVIHVVEKPTDLSTSPLSCSFLILISVKNVQTIYGHKQVHNPQYSDLVPVLWILFRRELVLHVQKRYLFRNTWQVRVSSRLTEFRNVYSLLHLP